MDRPRQKEVLDGDETGMVFILKATHTTTCRIFFSFSSHYCFCRLPYWPTSSTTTS